MSSTLATIRNLVKIDIGGRDDADALLVTDHSINLAILLAAILFKPIELRKNINFIYTASAAYYNLEATRWLDFIRVRDVTDSYDLRFVPFEILDRVVSSGLTIVKYYSLYGTNIFVRKIPTVDTTISIYYLEEPAKLTGATNPIPFEGFDGFIRTTATAAVFAAFEESEASSMWTNISSQLLSILNIGVDNKSTFGPIKAYLDQIVSITQGQGGK